MIKRGFLVGGILVLVALLVTGCVVLKEDYDAVVAERDSALAELQSVNNQLDNAQAQVSDLQGEVSDLQGEVSDLEGEVSDLGSELEEKQQQLSEVQQIVDSLEPKLHMQQLLGEYINKQGWFMVPDSSLSLSEWKRFARSEFRVDMETYLKAVDEPTLSIRYEDAIIWRAENWSTDFKLFDELLTLLGELIEADINELRAALAD